MMLQWTGGEQVQPLLHKVVLKGSKPPENYIFMRHSPPVVGKGET